MKNKRTIAHATQRMLNDVPWNQNHSLEGVLRIIAWDLAVIADCLVKGSHIDLEFVSEDDKFEDDGK